jgi:hypothetical protein
MMCSMGNQPKFGRNANLSKLKVQEMVVRRRSKFNFRVGRVDDPAAMV